MKNWNINEKKLSIFFVTHKFAQICSKINIQWDWVNNKFTKQTSIFDQKLELRWKILVDSKFSYNSYKVNVRRDRGKQKFDLVKIYLRLFWDV